MTCPFCSLLPDRVVLNTPLVLVIRDAYPVSPGHSLVIPRRHVETYFDATTEEQAAIWQAVTEVKRRLDAELRPEGYNVGFNVGRTAGQTVMHLHVHVIPRFTGDMDDPRGGVRGVIPARQKYGTGSASEEPPADPFGDLLDFVPGEEEYLLPQLLRAMRRADRIDLLSAFIQESGIMALEGELVDALMRSVQVRVLTGDYLGITHPHALQRLYTLLTAHSTLAVRFFAADTRPFHPKAYVFRRGSHAIAFVGSSNLSAGALTDSVEWNLRATASRDAATLARIVARFDRLWDAHASRPLTRELLEAYRSRVVVPPAPEPAAVRPKPNEVQREVLERLARTRESGASRGLVVMATGVGKTYLSAFDAEAMRARRILFVAHREEILDQAERSFARLFPDRTRGLLVGDRREVDADILFGSIQTLSRAAHLFSFAPDHFDYVVIDEFHHAAAASYRKVLSHFTPRFLLGLTATADRLDGASLLALCDDNLVARVGLVEGIARGLLVPFHYFGLKDVVDYAPIPWRSNRFDEEALTNAVATRERADQALTEYRKHAPAGPRRTLAFCASRRHADFMAGYLRESGVTAQAVHSGPGSAPRAETLARFREGQVEVLCAVDVFNEGLDVPDVNTVLMLRPTESPVIFLQQLGRGLRRPERIPKDALTVIDFIGNHRSFLRKPQALLALTGQDVPPGAALRILRSGELELPDGCTAVVETEALDLLEQVSRLSKDDQLIYEYLTFRESYGRRPSASELHATGVSLDPVRQRYGSWHDFVKQQGDLQPDELGVLEVHRAWLRDLLLTKMSKSYKMVALAVLLDADALDTGMDPRALAVAARQKLLRDPVLRADLEPGKSEEDFVRAFREMPLGIFLAAWDFSRRWFRLGPEELRSELEVAPGDRETFMAMTAELVDLRLREYRARHRHTGDVIPLNAPITLRVSHSGGNPILRFDRARRPDLPEGEVAVDVDGETLWFHFRKIAVNVVTERSGGPNVLPSCMRRWFGPGAGLPGTRHEVRLARVSDRWRLTPVGPAGEVPEVIPFPRLPFFENLRVACGSAVPMGDLADQQTALAVSASVPLDPRRHFVVRAEGDSMDGGDHPIADGDLVLCAWAEATSPDDVQGKVCLVSGLVGGDLASAQIKIPIRRDGRWFLRSANPSHPDAPLDEETTLRVVARVIETVQPAIGLELFGTYDRAAIAAQFGSAYSRSWQQGHIDVELHGRPHTVLLVTLEKSSDMIEAYHYADRFLSPTEFQWESQNQTRPTDKRGRAILEHQQQGRTIHLFVRYHGKTTEQKGEAFVYCGPVRYVRHQGEMPMRVWFELEESLPIELYRSWTD